MKYCIDLQDVQETVLSINATLLQKLDDSQYRSHQQYIKGC